MKLKCPICGNPLEKIEKSYCCENHHLFDIAKEGYVNLLKKQGHKEYGDSVDMVKARRNFFNKDYYHPLKQRLLEIIQEYKPTTIIDLGCGEGYYTNNFERYYPADYVGLDISKEAVRLASKQNSNVTYVVGSVQDIPLFDHSCDMVCNFFTPIDFKEIKRVLKEDGYLLSARVSKNHLLELKKAIYDEVYLNDNEPFVEENIELVLKEVINFPMHFDNNEDIVNLFNMTPYSHHTSLESKERLKKITSIDVNGSIDVELYQYKKLDK